jgi:hypothetical protein
MHARPLASSQGLKIKVGHKAKASSRPLTGPLRHLSLAATPQPRHQAYGAHGAVSYTVHGTNDAFISSNSPFHPSGSWRSFRQCMLLAAAAIGAAPALLLLDTAEQAVLGMQHLQQRVLTSVTPQQQVQGQKQRGSSTSCSQPHTKHAHVRRLLPLWPPVLPLTVAVAPLGLLLLECRRSCLSPILGLGASLLLQAYANLLLVIWARVKGSQAMAAPAAWAAAAAVSSTYPAAQASAAAVLGAPVQGWSSGGLTVKLFSWLQLAGDTVRCACCCCIAWLAIQAVHGHAAGVGDQAAGILGGAVQQFAHAANLAHGVAAMAAAAAAMQQLARVWLPSVCVAAVSLASAGVYAASLLSRCNSRQ